LSQASGITLQCAAGVFNNLCALGHCSTEEHYKDRSLITFQLTTEGVYYAPADPALFNLSVWDGTLTWNTSYWR
jgi:hypothetical protein